MGLETDVSAADRQTGRQTGRQIGRQADRQTNRQTDRQTCISPPHTISIKKIIFNGRILVYFKKLCTFVNKPTALFNQWVFASLLFYSQAVYKKGFWTNLFTYTGEKLQATHPFI